MAKKSTKTYEKKRDFLQMISMMNQTELNDYIKRHGPGVKPVVMCYIVDNKLPRKEGKV